jgi:hypothetical protein
MLGEIDMICPKCGDVVFEGAVFCVRCGAMLAGTRVENRDATAPRPSNPWLKIAAGMLTATAAIVVLVSLSLGRSSGPAVRYVPDVVGMSRANAEAKLAKAGFECAIGEERPSDTTDVGAVISQYPRPDTPTSRMHVSLVLSLGADTRKSASDEQSRRAPLAARRPPTTTSARPAATPKSEKPAQRRQVVRSRPRARQTATVAASLPAKPEISGGSGYGSVAIETQPGDWEVWVYVDGGPARGKCPITVRLPAGEHSLVLWEPSQQKRLAVPVTVEADRTVSVRKDLGA